MNDIQLFKVDIHHHYVYQDANPADGDLQYQVYRGYMGGQLITARLYLHERYRYSHDSGLIPAILKRYRFTNVLNYRGYTSTHSCVYYIFDSYLFPLCRINPRQFPLRSDNAIKLTIFSRPIYRCILEAIEELRARRSMHLEFNETDVVVVMISDKFIQVKLIIREYITAPPNASEQITRDFFSVGTIHQFILRRGDFSFEGDDLLNRLFKTGKYAQPRNHPDSLILAFGLDALKVLRHPWFWTPPEDVYFLEKLGALLPSIVKLYRSKPDTEKGAEIFLQHIDGVSVGIWKSKLLPNEGDQELVLRSVNEGSGVDFVIGVRHLSFHYPKITKESQDNLKTHPWPFVGKIYDICPNLIMNSYDTVEGFFGLLSDHFNPLHFNDCLILPVPEEVGEEFIHFLRQFDGN